MLCIYLSFVISLAEHGLFWFLAERCSILLNWDQFGILGLLEVWIFFQFFFFLYFKTSLQPHHLFRRMQQCLFAEFSVLGNSILR